MKTALLAAAALLALGGVAHAQRTSGITGGRLAGICSASSKAQADSCDAYITGVTDSAVVYQKLRPADGSAGGSLPSYLCIPGQVTGEQMRRQYVGWMRDHRDQANTIASETVLTAMQELYSCKGR